MTAALACQKTSQHQTSTGLLWACGGNRVTSAFSRSPMCSPTSTPKPRAEGSSPSAPAKNSATAFAVALFFVIGRNVLATRCGRRPACGACRGASACRWHASYEPTEAAAETSPSAPARKPAKTLGFRRFSFCLCCMGMGFILVRTLGFPIRFYPFPTVPIPSSTQNAPGFAFFGPNRVLFSLFLCFSGAKFLPWFLCTLLHSVYKLKPSVIPCKREVSFLT